RARGDDRASLYETVELDGPIVVAGGHDRPIDRAVDRDTAIQRAGGGDGAALHRAVDVNGRVVAAVGYGRPIHLAANGDIADDRAIGGDETALHGAIEADRPTVVAGGQNRTVHRAVDGDVADDRAVCGDGATLHEAVDSDGAFVQATGDHGRSAHRAVGNDAAEVHDVFGRSGVRESRPKVSGALLPLDRLDGDAARDAVRDNLTDEVASADDLPSEPRAVGLHGRGGDHGALAGRGDIDPADIRGHLRSRLRDRIGPDPGRLDGAGGGNRAAGDDRAEDARGGHVGQGTADDHVAQGPGAGDGRREGRFRQAAVFGTADVQLGLDRAAVAAQTDVFDERPVELVARIEGLGDPDEGDHSSASNVAVRNDVGCAAAVGGAHP